MPGPDYIPYFRILVMCFHVKMVRSVEGRDGPIALQEEDANQTLSECVVSYACSS